MNRVNKFHTITSDHPFYDEIMASLNVSPDVDVSNYIDYKAMMTDYNNLPVGGFLAFLYHGKTNPRLRFERTLGRRGLKLGKSPADDCALFVLPICAVEATALVAASSMKAVSAEKFDAVTAVDEDIPRRSTSTLNSESLPQLAGVWQVYIYKKSETDGEMDVETRGRPKMSANQGVE